MALVNCPACGQQISTTAPSCPHCGHTKTKRKPLGCGALILVLALGGAFMSMMTPSPPATTAPSTPKPKPAADTGDAPQTAQNRTSTPRPKPAWTTSTSTDKMTGKASAYAHSPRTGSTERMKFPYAGVEAWLGVGCDADSEWAYIGFTEAPNLINTDIRDGYNSIRTRIRWGDEIKQVPLTQKWGASFLHFQNDVEAIDYIASASNALLELSWYGSGDVYFEFSLNGSSAALREIRQFCR